MGAFGENLRREREMRGIALQEISDATKIGKRMLDAIETERFERLPGGVFNRAFVRQYARYLGLDEEHVVADFDVACNAAEAAERSKQGQVLPTAWVQRRMIEKDEEDNRQRRRWPVAIAVGVVVLAALAIGGWRWLGPKPGEGRVEPPPRLKSAPPPPPQHDASPRDAGTPVAGADTQAAPPQNGPEVITVSPADGIRGLRVELEAAERVSITASSDGRRPWSAVMRPGSRRIIQASGSVQIEVSNAGGLTTTVNGVGRGLLGVKDQKKTVTYTLQDPQGRSRAGGQRP